MDASVNLCNKFILSVGSQEFTCGTGTERVGPCRATLLYSGLGLSSLLFFSGPFSLLFSLFSFFLFFFSLSLSMLMALCQQHVCNTDIHKFLVEGNRRALTHLCSTQHSSDPARPCAVVFLLPSESCRVEALVYEDRSGETKELLAECIICLTSSATPFLILSLIFDLLLLLLPFYLLTYEHTHMRKDTKQIRS
eukprot:gene8918-6254_t